MMGNAPECANATGMADYRFKLALPIAAVERATVRGSITLAGNDLQAARRRPSCRERGASSIFLNRLLGYGGSGTFTGW